MASKNINVLLSLVDKFSAPLRKVRNNVNSSARAMQRTQNGAVGMSSAMTSSFSRAAGAAKYLFSAITAVTSGVAAVGAGVVKQYAEHEKTMAGLSFLLGEKQAQDLDKFAAVIGKTTDLSRKGALDIAKSWAASGASLDVAKENIKILTDMAAAGSMTEEQIGLVNTQLIQMFGRGYAERGDLKAISNSLPGVFNYLKDYLHVTQEELDEMIKKHQVTADQTMKAIQAKTKGAADAVGNTLVSKFNNIKDTVQNISTAFGGSLAKALNIGAGMDYFSKSLDKVEEFATGLQEAINSGKEPITALREEVNKLFGSEALADLDKCISLVTALVNAFIWWKNTVFEIVSFLMAHPVLSQILLSVPAVIAGTVLIAGAILRIKAAIDAVKITIGILNAIMATNPFILAIMAIIAVVMLLYFNWDRITAFFRETTAAVRNWFTETWNSIKNTVLSVWDSITASFTSCIDRLKGLWTDFKNFIAHPIDTIVNYHQRKMEERKDVPHNATGTSYFQGGQTYVNEGNRGELITLPSGSQIIPHDLAAETVQKSAAPVINLNLTIAGNVIGNEDFYNDCGRVITDRIVAALANM